MVRSIEGLRQDVKEGVRKVASAADQSERCFREELEETWRTILSARAFIRDEETADAVEKVNRIISARRGRAGESERCLPVKLPVPRGRLDIEEINERRELLEDIESGLPIYRKLGGVDTETLEATSRELRKELEACFNANVEEA